MVASVACVVITLPQLMALFTSICTNKKVLLDELCYLCYNKNAGSFGSAANLR